jgi:hypothetical protein
VPAPNSETIRVKALTAVLFCCIVAFHLLCAVSGKPLFRAVHLGTALEYAHGPINILRPIVVGYDANDAPMAQELPLWQAAVGGLLKLAGSNWYGWANVVSLISFGFGLWPYFQLARRYAGEREAWWALAFFLAEPVVVFAAGLGSTDGFCLTLTLWFLYFADQMIRTGGVRWWVAATVFASLSAVSKLPFFMTAGLCSVAMLIVAGVKSWRPWLLLIAAGSIAAIVFAVWTWYTNKLLGAVEYPYQELRFSKSPQAIFWYFGDLKYRLSPGPWIKGGWRFLHGTLGSLPLVVLLATAIIRQGNRLPKLWLLATFVTTLVFTQIVLVHWHYYLMCCPAVAMLCGITIARWESFWQSELPGRCLRTGLIAFALLASATDGLIAMKIGIYMDYYPKEMSEVIRQHTRPEDKLVVYGSDWGAEELFRSGRRGFNVFRYHTYPGVTTEIGLYELLNDPAHLKRLKELGYTKLVLLSESPVKFAAVAVNPGSHRLREVYPASISPTVDSWPVVFRSDDILIKELGPGD